MTTGADPIICRATSWYHKRRIAMLLLFFGFSVAFFYDWKFRYPRNKEAFETLEKMKAEKQDADYAKLAAEKDWPERPEAKNWDYAIKEQLVFGILTAIGGAVMLYFYIRTVRGSLSADAASFSTADGQHVPFASAFRIDRRKWDHKGLAYVYYRDARGREKRAVIDDLIFGGAVKVLERLEANFKGEVIDLDKSEPLTVPAGAGPDDSGGAAG